MESLRFGLIWKENTNFKYARRNSTASLVAEKPPSPGKKTLAEVTKNENL